MGTVLRPEGTELSFQILPQREARAQGASRTAFYQTLQVYRHGLKNSSREYRRGGTFPDSFSEAAVILILKGHRPRSCEKGKSDTHTTHELRPRNLTILANPIFDL